MFQLILWSTAPLLAAVVTLSAYRRLRDRAPVPGLAAVRALLAAVLFLSVARLLGTLAPDLAAKLLLFKLASVALALIPVLWFLFGLGYARRQQRMPRRLVNALCVIPLASVALTMTNEWHGLVWTDAAVVVADGARILEYQHGPWFAVHALYSYGLVLVATVIMAYSLVYTPGQARALAAVILAPLAVAAADALRLSPWNPAPWFDPTTVGFAIATLSLRVALLNRGLLDNIPVLRERVLEQLTEGVMVLGEGGRVVDVNAAALGILRRNREQVAGRSLTDLLPHVRFERFVAERLESLEMHARGRTYDVTWSPLDRDDPESRVVLVFRDVTSRKNAEQALRGTQQELQRLAHTDPLTGLYNRRLFLQRLEEEAHRTARHKGYLSVLVFDLDHFKQINDRYGHDAGDRVLQAVAATLLKIKRASDVAARMGGEEFALLLPETGNRGAWNLAERLRAAIEDIDTVALLGKGAHGSRRITASIGVASLARRAPDSGTLLKLADSALYRAKNAGRNQVCAAA